MGRTCTYGVGSSIVNLQKYKRHKKLCCLHSLPLILNERQTNAELIVFKSKGCIWASCKATEVLYLDDRLQICYTEMDKAVMFMKMNKKDFNAGSPYSCWLKEELVGEVSAHLHNFENRGLIKKYKVYVDNETENVIMGITKLDDLPDGLKKVAVDIIRMELDKSFKG